MTRTPIATRDKVAIAFITAYTIGTVGKSALIEFMGMV